VGADKICQDLATAVGAGSKTWRAYLSTNTPKVNARERIGTGPWHNAKGTLIAQNLEDLHTAIGTGATAKNFINKDNGLTEKGQKVNGVGDSPNEHDILTGSTIDGMAFANQTCGDWTGKDTAHIGHHDRMGGSSPMKESWNSVHENGGCETLAAIRNRGGAGRFYCFALTQ
jgi:hypothetical protein